LQEVGAIDILVNNAGVGLAGAVEMVPLNRVRQDRMTAGGWAALLTEEGEQRFVSRADTR